LPQARFFFFLDAWALLAFEHLDQSALSRITAPWPPYAPARSSPTLQAGNQPP
jgi:hypothetical protein